MKGTMLQRGMAAVCLLIVFSQARAIEPFQEYRKRIESSQNISALTDGLFGDSVSLFNGQTTYSNVDIDLPGNGSLPVQLVRRFAVEIHPQGGTAYNTVLGGAGGWDIDVPHISGMFGSWSDQRCSSSWVPSVNVNFSRTEVWQGNLIHIPGGSNRTMLAVETQTPVPSDGLQHKITTSERDSFDCIPMQSGLAGEGFRMRTTAGVRYYFDIAVQRYAGTMTRTVGGGMVASTSRNKIYVLASKIEDRFGNTVNFQYNSNGNPTRIWSSDGREIVLTYANGQLASATAAGKTWLYQYGTVEGQTRLTSLVLPDNSRWQYGYSNALQPQDQTWDGNSDSQCMEQPPELPVSFAFTITHPSGAVGSFTFNNTRHYRSGVHVSECLIRVAQGGGEFGSNYWILNTPNFFDVMTLNQKVLSGPGLTQPMTWSYSYGGGYQPLWGNVGSAAVYPCSTCATEKLVTVTNPDSTKTRYRYGFLFALNEGRVLGTETIDASGVTRRTETTDYLTEAEATGQNFSSRYGIIQSGDEPSTARVRPVTRKTIQQDGVTFTSEVNKGCGGAAVYCLDLLARPTAETKANSLGDSKVEGTEYYDDFPKWVLNQVKRSTTAGIETTRTDYDAATVLPIRTYKFGKLQQTLTYNADATIATVSDGRDGVGGVDTTITLSGWKRGVPQSIKHPATPESPTGAVQSAVVNDNGTLASVTDENGYKTCYGYDAMGRLASITHPSEATAGVCDTSTWNVTTASFVPVAASEYGLSSGHWRHTVNTGSARKITYFDALWRPVVEESFDATDATTTTNTRSLTVKRYDIAGQLAFQSYPRGSLGVYTDATLKGSRTTYDALDRVTRVEQDNELGTAPLITETKYLTGFKTEVTNPLLKKTTTSYMAYDQPSTDWPVAIAHPEETHTEIARDVFGKPLSLTRHNTDNTSWQRRYFAYDPYQRLCKRTEVETGTTATGYDEAGNLLWSAAGLGWAPSGPCPTAADTSARRVDRTYDARNRVTTLTFPDGRGNQVWEYTPDGLPKTVTTYNAASNGLPVVNDYSYNKRRLLMDEASTQPGWYAWHVGYGYNANGHASTLTYPNNTTVTFAPNALGQPTQAGAFATGVSYHPNGAIKQFTYGNGIVHTLTQNLRGLPDTSRDAFGATEVLDDRYEYDANGNVAAILDGMSADGRGNREMWYDGLDRLTRAESLMFGTSATSAATYSYDGLDNLTRVTVPGSAQVPGRDHFYCYDSGLRLTNVKTGGCTGSGTATVIGLGYDVQGNLVNKNGQGFDFDFGNRLRQATGTETYRYDAHGRRVLASSSAGYILSQYGQGGQLLYQSDQRDSLGKAYVYLGGSLVAVREQPLAGGAAVAKYQHTDALGSPVAVTSGSCVPNCVVLERSEYEPFGQLLNRPLKDGPGYTGHVLDKATGLNYMQQRYYDPGIGRFLSTDPVQANLNTGASFNRYVYASSNPYKFIDPDGRADINLNHRDDGLWTAAERFDIPGFTTVIGHSNSAYFEDNRHKPSLDSTVNQYALDANATISEISKVHKKGDWIFLGGCGLGRGGIPQAVANHFKTNVIATDGYVLGPSTDNGWSGKGGFRYRANQNPDGSGESRSFRVFGPGGGGPSGSIGTVRMTDSGKVVFTAATPELGTRIRKSVEIKSR